MMVQLLGFSVILLMTSGCANKEFKLGWYPKCLPKTVVQIERKYPSIGSDKLRCDEIPRPDVMVRQSEVANYLIDMSDSGNQCRDNLIFVRNSLARFREDNASK